MIDLTFIHAVEAAVAAAVTSSVNDNLAKLLDGEKAAAPAVRSLCKQVAQRLYFDLDGQTLLDLAIIKLGAEQYPANAVPPANAAARGTRAE